MRWVSQQPGAAELVLRGARLGIAGPPVDLTVGAGRVLRIQPVEDRRAGDPADLESVDLDGSTVLPGLWDGHVHSRQWALRRHGLDLTLVSSAAAAARRIVGSGPGDPVVIAFGAALMRWTPHKDLLAEESRPVLIQAGDLHSAWLNQPALDLAGFSDHPTGLLREADGFAAVAALCARPELQADAWVLESMAEAAARGVVGIVDFEMADNLADWTRRADVGRLPTRVECSIPRHLAELAVAHGHRTGGVAADRVTVGPVKLFLDGSLTSGTAARSPGQPTLIPPDDVSRLVGELAGHGLQCAIHAIGEQATTVALDAFAGTRGGGRIEHAQLVRITDLPRFAAHDVVASVQPGHLTGDRDLELWASRGTTGAYPYAALLAAGARLELGSDAPVVPLDPWATIAAAVQRTADERPPWIAGQRLSVTEALAASTRGRTVPAIGDPADLVVVGADFGRDPTRLAATEVHATMVDGRWTFRA